MVSPYQIILENYPPRRTLTATAKNKKSSTHLAIYHNHIILPTDDLAAIIVLTTTQQTIETLLRTTHNKHKFINQLLDTIPITVIDLADPESIPWLEQHVFRPQNSEKPTQPK